MKFVLKAPGTMRLKLYNDKLLSTFAFKFNLRRYIVAYLEEGFFLVGRCRLTLSNPR